jgi:hypothetical protein
MLTPQQSAHFDTFGFAFFRQAFSPLEMATITSAAEEIWRSDEQEIEGEERRLGYFVERSQPLTALVTDERIYPVITDLLGPDLLWICSEGNISNRSTVGWHPDRKYYLSGEEHWMDFAQIKMMIYLDEIDRNSGCLRVIPGSHRMPFHKSLALQEVDSGAQPFGVDGPDIPCVALTSQPGDIILFNHTLWHAPFGGGLQRRYIALKFAAWPTAAYHIESLEKYGTGVFEPHENFVNSDDVRIRDMVRVPP